MLNVTIIFLILIFVFAGEDIKHPVRDHVVARKDDVKYAFVQLVSSLPL